MVSLGSICADAHARPVVVLLVSLVAVLDTWLDGVGVCVGLGALHVLFLRFGCVRGACCV